MKRVVLCLAATLILLPSAAARADGEEDAGGTNPRVKMETSLGDIVLELDVEKAPLTVHNFLRYAEEGYYDGTVFHRVMKTFMIQGGGFTPDIQKKTEGLHPTIRNEWQNGLKNDRGTISGFRIGQTDFAGLVNFPNLPE